MTRLGTAAMNYEEFIRRKVVISKDEGIAVDLSEINPILKDHQKLIVQWLVRGGRRACFAAFGLGKSVIQLETVRIVRQRVGGLALIVIPLGVRQEFTRDAAMLGITTKFIRRIDEVQDESVIYLTNYETIRDGKLDPKLFTVASLDEASILRGFGGTKTFREFMATFAGDRKTMDSRVKTAGTPFRFVATATPSPNEYIELLAYAAFLGVMDVSAAKTRFFKRDSVKADNLTIHPHKEREFWLWVASWALFVQKPSDLGCSDDGYTMPDMDVRWHEVEADHENAGHEVYGQARMFRAEALGVVESSKEKRESLNARVGKIIKIIYDDVSLKQHESNDGQGPEAGVHESVLPGQQRKAERTAKAERKGELSSEARDIQRENESLARSKPGKNEATAAELSGKESGEIEGNQQAPLLEQQGFAQCARQASQGGEIRDNRGELCGNADGPGWCLRNLQNGQAFTEDGQLQDRPLPQNGGGSRASLHEMQQRAWHVSGQTGLAPECDGLSDQIVIWCDLNAEQVSIEKALKEKSISFTSLYGAQGIDEREEELIRWKNKDTTVLLTKPVMYGAGVNLQQCHTMIFAGINFKAQDLLQSIHRIHRFMQEHTCSIHIIYTSAEREVKRQLVRKWQQHNEMVEKMTAIMKEFGLSQAAMAHTLTRVLGVDRAEVRGKTFTAIHNDCVKETATMEENSVGLILTSIPFSTQYEYSPNYSDFGHTDNNEHFFQQMDYLTPNLLKILKPGRICAVHVKDRIVPGGMTGLGFQTVYPLHCKTIEHYVKHGFGYMGMKTIVTDVVRENNQTYRLGWTEQCKDGTKMGVGMPEYLLLFRKPPTSTEKSYADEPVVKSKEKYTRGRWQIDAHGFARSNGNRFLTPEELAKIPHEAMFKAYRKFSLENVYDFEHHVGLNDGLALEGMLPVTFMLLQPQSWHPDVYTDITRMLTLNTSQSARNKEMHLCPMQFDLADRVITQFSNKGDVVFDPFGGLMTVPYRAIKLGRFGMATELSASYFSDGVGYLAAAERDMNMPTLFDMDEVEAEFREAA